MCFCAHLPELHARTRVVFLQHPREKRVAISTCRMAHLALAGSSLHSGVIFDGNAELEALCSDASGGVAVLFPGEGSLDPTTLPDGQLHTLIVIDGTWSQARKLVQRNALFARLPRLGLAPSRPSNYRIRREPAENCVSTIEAVVEVLGLLEGDVDRFRGALAAFDHMVDTQIACRDSRQGPPRHKRRRVRQARPVPVPVELAGGIHDAVVFYAEANVGFDERGQDAAPELLHLVAARPATGQRFEALVRPRRALGSAVPWQLELPAARFADGESIESALARFAEFAGEDSLLCGWGRFAHDLVRTEVQGIASGLGLQERRFVDLRLGAARRLKRRPGGVEKAAFVLCAREASAWTEGRAGRRIAALEAVLYALVQRDEAPAAAAIV